MTETKGDSKTNLRALILVGGYGTRLRPLTFEHPKPLVPFCGEAIVVHQIEALVEVGVKEIILAVNYQPQVMVEYLKTCEEKYGIKIIISQETIPMGTAGPLFLAKHYLQKDDSQFFMFNSDVICEFPLQKMLAFHRHHGKEGTIMVTKVKDPRAYGVVVSAPNGEIQRFVEKPQEFISDEINAGIYLFNPSIVNRIENRPTSIERETFPAMAKDKDLYSMVLEGYWMDIGQPKDYLRGLVLHLESIRIQKRKQKDGSDTRKRKLPDLVEEKQGDRKWSVQGNVLLHSSVKVGEGSVLGPDVEVGPGVEIGKGVRIKRSTLFQGTKVGSYAYINSSIVGWQSNIGDWARVDDCVFGDDVEVGKETSLKGVTVCPHKALKEDTTDKIIL